MTALPSQTIPSSIYGFTRAGIQLEDVSYELSRSLPRGAIRYRRESRLFLHSTVHWKKREWNLAEENFKRTEENSLIRLDLLLLEIERGNKPNVQDDNYHIPERIPGRGGKGDARFFYYKLPLTLTIKYFSANGKMPILICRK